MQAKPNFSDDDSLSLDGLEDLLEESEADDLHEQRPLQDFSVEETAKTLGLTRGAVIRRLEDGILEGYRIKRPYGIVWRVCDPRLFGGEAAQDSKLAEKKRRIRRFVEQTRRATSEQAIATESSGLMSADSMGESGSADSMGADSNYANSAHADSFDCDSFDRDSMLGHSVNAGSIPLNSMGIDLSGTLNLQGPDRYAEPSTERLFSKDRSRQDAGAPGIEPMSDLNEEDLLEHVEVSDVDLDEIYLPAVSRQHEMNMLQLRSKLEATEFQFQDTLNKLDQAHYRIGYLEARLESTQEQMRLLTDQHAHQPWWQRWRQWFRTMP